MDKRGEVKRFSESSLNFLLRVEAKRDMCMAIYMVRGGSHWPKQVAAEASKVLPVVVVVLGSCSWPLFVPTGVFLASWFPLRHPSSWSLPAVFLSVAPVAAFGIVPVVPIVLWWPSWWWCQWSGGASSVLGRGYVGWSRRVIGTGLINDIRKK